MARPKSNDKRNAIMDAATRVIVTHGLSAPTATIAKEAGISNGSLFTYFETKTELFNQLYLELKADMSSAIIKGFPEKAELRDQASHIWSNWMKWATANPDKRRVLALLSVSDQITAETRAATLKLMSSLAAFMERVRASGAMRNASMQFMGAIVTSLAETTMDFMIKDPTNAKKHCKVGFETFWRALA